MRRWISEPKAQFVAINLLVNLLFLVRGYVFMIALGYRDLGLVSLLQSIVMLLGIMQFGVLSGGYRLILSEDEDKRRQIVDLVYTFIALLTLAGLIVAGAAFVWLDNSSDAVIGLLGVVGGGAMLVRNWQTNQLIAAERLPLLNAINFGAALVSLLPLAFLDIAPLAACAATLVLYPLAFAIPAWFAGADQRPRGFALGLTTARGIMAAGFLVFLAGMLLQVNIQIERWYVTLELGVEALGHLFVATMFVTVLQLVPNALNAVFLPPAVAAKGAADTAALRRTLRQYAAVLLAYATAAGLAVWLLAEPVLALLAPFYIPDLTYVYLIAPGALAITVAGAFGLGFVVFMQYRAMIAAYALGTAGLAAACLIALGADMPLSLEGISIARSMALGVTAVGIVLGWALLARKQAGLRFLSLGGSRD